MPRARFFYGVSAGCGVGWLLLTFDVLAGWILVVASLALLVAIFFHRQHRREAMGRRWRRTTSLIER
ncbi:MAG TPA: hypothetical protein VEB69_14095 [Acidimicrobiia bacterium]|nr:hypothetical protein [Acidimicrobiia bacterium]